MVPTDKTVGSGEMWESIVLLSVASLTSGISLRVVEPMLPQLADDFTSSISAASAVITGFALAYTIGQLGYGPLGDRFGKLRVVTLSMLGAAAGSFGCAMAPDLGSLTALRFVTALCSASPVTLGMAYVGDEVPLADRQTVIARFVTGTIIGQALGPLVGGFFTDFLGWRSAFLVIGTAFAIVSLVLYLRTRLQWEENAISVAEGNPFTVQFRLLAVSRVRIVVGCAFVNAFFFFGAYAFLGPYLKLRFDLSATVIGTLLALVGLGSVLYTLVVKRLLASLGQPGLVAWGGAICCACYALAVLTPFWVVTVPCSIGLGFSFYMLINTLQVRASEMSPHARGAGISVYTAGWALGQACGVAVAGMAIGLIGFTASIIGFGIGYLALGLWLRANLDRLS